MFKSHLKSRPPAVTADYSGSFKSPTSFKVSKGAMDDLGLQGDITALGVDPVGGWWALGAFLQMREQSLIEPWTGLRVGILLTDLPCLKSANLGSPFSLTLPTVPPQVFPPARFTCSDLLQSTCISPFIHRRTRRPSSQPRRPSSTSSSTRAGSGSSSSTQRVPSTSGSST
jgi:hypothetical protein